MHASPCDRKASPIRIGEDCKIIKIDMRLVRQDLVVHMQTADDLFGTPQRSPRTDKLIDASIQWAELIMKKIDCRFAKD